MNSNDLFPMKLFYLLFQIDSDGVVYMSEGASEGGKILRVTD